MYEGVCLPIEINSFVFKPDKEASETKSLRELLRGHSYYDFEVSGSLEIQNGT